MSLLRLIFACLLFLSSTSSQAETTYTVSRVYDGDTVELKNANGKLKLRLTDIDAPERNQAYGQKARRALIELCKGSDISINFELAGQDKYNRHLGKLQCNHTDASVYMGEQGYAWHNEKYSQNLAVKNAAARARRDRVGLWSSDNPLPPWVWRRLYGNSYQSAR
jgi:endonuclease YncB( thermonuclease family)